MLLKELTKRLLTELDPGSTVRGALQIISPGGSKSTIIMGDQPKRADDQMGLPVSPTDLSSRMANAEELERWQQRRKNLWPGGLDHVPPNSWVIKGPDGRVRTVEGFIMHWPAGARDDAAAHRDVLNDNTMGQVFSLVIQA